MAKPGPPHEYLANRYAKELKTGLPPRKVRWFKRTGCQRGEGAPNSLSFYLHLNVRVVVKRFVELVFGLAV